VAIQPIADRRGYNKYGSADGHQRRSLLRAETGIIREPPTSSSGPAVTVWIDGNTLLTRFARITPFTLDNLTDGRVGRCIAGVECFGIALPSGLLGTCWSEGKELGIRIAPRRGVHLAGMGNAGHTGAALSRLGGVGVTVYCARNSTASGRWSGLY